MKLTIIWEIDDGYVGKSRPHKTIFDTDDWTNDEEEWNELSEQQKKEYIEEAVQNDFDQTIFFYISDYDL